MLMTPILDYRPRPGLLVEWVVGQDTAAAAEHAEPHPAPPSYVQERHIRRALANQESGKIQSPWLATVFDLPGRLDTTAMATALEKWVRRHPTLLTFFRLDADRLRRHAVPAAEFSLRTEEIGRFDSAERIRERLHDRFDEGTSPLTWPSFVAGAIVRDDSSTVYFAVDHAHSDGYSIILVFDELRRLYRAEVDGTPADLPETGSYVDFCALERARAAEVTADSPAVRQWLDFWISGGGQPPRFPLDLGVAPDGTYPAVPVDLDLFDAAEADAFAAACKRLGGGFSAGLLAALGIANHELAGLDGYRGLAVVHTRDEPRWATTQGWFINLVPVRFPVAGAAGFGDVLRPAQEAFAAARGLAGVSVHRVAEVVTEALNVQADPRAVLPMVSYIDTRPTPGAEDWERSDCQVLGGPGDSHDVPIWVNRLPRRTYLKASHPDTPQARANVPRYLEHVREILRTVARTGDYAVRTPAAAGT
ncbi:Condensation domain-containing protein [Amycolatopsis arida]|uniref:Condensation domain-containing protein n=1 Tax=Amycolatopsis arida TaxID=587909 RepID=A0A1I5XVR3_9PSEU|nr:condensation domain-containing protein [Amycolatopsis arida]TDX97239.1 condensation domain-containing protein [Amycolatopsis arida]SFQ35986.1 Condensation domain-containing protein [Amycolatopsis arida]